MVIEKNDKKFKKKRFFSVLQQYGSHKKNDKKYTFLIKITILVPKMLIFPERPPACKRLKNKKKNVKKGF